MAPQEGNEVVTSRDEPNNPKNDLPIMSKKEEKAPDMNPIETESNSTLTPNDAAIKGSADIISLSENKAEENDISLVSKKSRTNAKETKEQTTTTVPAKSQVETTPQLDSPKSVTTFSSKKGEDKKKNEAIAQTDEPPRFLSKKKLDEELSIRKLQVSVEGKLSFLGRTWYILMAVVATLDFLSKILVDIIDQQNENSPDDSVIEKKPFLSRFTKTVHQILETEETLMESLIRLLHENSTFIGIAFSLLWFANAFVSARKKRYQRIHQLDRKSLLVSTENSFQDKLKMYRNAWRSYVFEIVIQCLLLPLSFYLILRYLFKGHDSITTDFLDDDDIYHFNFTTAKGKHDEVHSFHVPVGISAILVIFQYFGVLFARITHMAVRVRIKRIAIKISKRTASFAIRNPRRFTRKFKELLSVLRWIKYLIPLIATGNKLRGNALDLIKKRHQRLEAVAAKKVRQQLWNNRLKSLPRKDMLPEAALMVQRNFRQRKAKQSVLAFRAAQHNVEARAAQTVQIVFRKRLLEARLRILHKKNEFKLLKKKHNGAKKTFGGKGQGDQLSNEERQRMYELEQELMAKANEMLNRKMLLRPNTRFSVIWKIFFVFCVFFEISILAVKPMLENHVNEKTGEQMKFENVLELYLIPTPVAELEQCMSPTELEQRNIMQEDEKKGILPWIKKLRRKYKKEDIIFLTENEADKINDEDKPWYCNEKYATAQDIWTFVLKLLIRQFLGFVGLVCFLDVFITFFTGELDPANGNLIPKPFFARWILPGMLLQLLVNPQMETVSKHVWNLEQYAYHLGFVRVFRWTIVLFYPLFKLLSHKFIHEIWRPIVESSNNRKVKD